MNDTSLTLYRGRPQHLGCDHAASHSFKGPRSGCRPDHPDHEGFLQSLPTSASCVAPACAVRAHWSLPLIHLRCSAAYAARDLRFRATRLPLPPPPLLDIVVRDTPVITTSSTASPLDLEKLQPPMGPSVQDCQAAKTVLLSRYESCCIPPPIEPGLSHCSCLLPSLHRDSYTTSRIDCYIQCLGLEPPLS